MTVLELTREQQPAAAPESREIRYTVDAAAIAAALAERLLAGRTISVLEATPAR